MDRERYMSLNEQEGLERIPRNWDLIIIGGGVTAAGVLREASSMGLRCLLLEQRDFSWGTSSRSAKLVHGGLRYLKQGKIWLTRDSVLERERLLKEAPGLVEPIGFLTPVYEGKSPGRVALSAGLALYDLIAGMKQRRYYPKDAFVERVPWITQKGLKGGFRFVDAQVDDSRLVLRLINESVGSGSVALNYTAVKEILHSGNNRVEGVLAEDLDTGISRELSSTVIINATGVWAERLSPFPDPEKRLRPLRGSHLVLPRNLLPILDSISFNHPLDNRPLYICPWEGALIFGATDVDHDDDLMTTPSITRGEIDYLLEGFKAYFPDISLSQEMIISTFAGVRPVISKGKLKASQESREHEVWIDNGLVTVTGGKLTTFRKLAKDAISAARPYINKDISTNRDDPVFRPPEHLCAPIEGISEKDAARLFGRYGNGAKELLTRARPEDLTKIPGVETLWAELPFVASNEKVRRLTDLLLRRVRIGHLIPNGASAHMPRIRKLCLRSLKWSEEKWEKEVNDYLKVWRKYYSIDCNAADSKHSGQ
jgi:glycerol-3-phosphate dehydrogenase